MSKKLKKQEWIAEIRITDVPEEGDTFLTRKEVIDLLYDLDAWGVKVTIKSLQKVGRS